MIGILKYLSVWQLAKCQDHMVMSPTDFGEAQAKANMRGYKKGRAEAIDGFAKVYKEWSSKLCDETEGCEGWCIDCFAKWYKEQKNERRIDG